MENRKNIINKSVKKIDKVKNNIKKIKKTKNITSMFGGVVNIITNMFSALFSSNIVIVPVIIIIIIIAIVMILFWFLLSFKPLVPFKMENLYFERYLTKLDGTITNDYKQYYYNKCNNIKLINYKTYTGNNLECKKPDLLITKFYFDKMGYADASKLNTKYTDNQKNLINGLTTLSIMQSLHKIMIFKNFISGQYNLTRISNNKMKLVLDKEDTIGNVYNPFNSIFQGSFIFTGNIIDNNKKNNINYILSENQKVKIDKDRYFNNNVFFGKNEENTEIKLKSEKFFDMPIKKINELSGYKDKHIYIKTFVSKNISAKELNEFIQNFNNDYGDIVYNFLKDITKKYNNINTDNFDNKPSKITVCSDKPIKVPYFIHYLSHKEQRNGVSTDTDIEKVFVYDFVCFTFNNIYINKKLKQGFNSKLHIGQFTDMDVELNLYNMGLIYDSVKKTEDKKYITRFKNKYNKKIKDNIVSTAILRGYKFLTHTDVLSNFLWFYKENIKTISPNNLLYNGKDNVFNFYVKGCIKKGDKCNSRLTEIKSPFLEKICDDNINNCSKEDFIEKVGYRGAYMFENTFFNYLKSLLLYDNKDKGILNNIDKGGQYIINYGNNRTTTLYNTYFSPLFNEFEKKYNNEKVQDNSLVKGFNAFYNIISDSSDDIKKYDSIYKYSDYTIQDFFKKINKYNKHLHNSKDYVNYYIPKDYEMGWNNIVNEINQVGLNPSIIFFRTNNMSDMEIKFDERYFKTKFKNLEGYLILPQKDTVDKLSNIDLLLSNKYFKDKINEIFGLFNANNKYYGGTNKSYDYKKNELIKYLNNKIKFSKGVNILDDLIISKHIKKGEKSSKIGYNYYMTLQIIADILYKSVYKIQMTNNQTKCNISIVWHHSNNYFDCNKKDEVIKKLLNYLIENKKNNIYYKTSFVGEIAITLRWVFFDKQNANKEIVKNDDILGKQNLQELTNFIENMYKIKSYINEIKNFYKTKTVNTIFLLNYLYNPNYFRNNSYLYNYSFYKEYEENDNNYTNVLAINIMDKKNQDIYSDDLNAVYKYGYNPVLYNKLFLQIQNLDCEKILKQNNVSVNDYSINDCKKSKKAILVYLSVEKNLDNVDNFLKSKLDNHKETDIYKMLVNGFYAGQCTWFVKSKKPQITWGGNAKDWCHNALTDKSAKVIYDYNNVDTGDIIVWDWKKYGHVAIVKKIFKDKNQILVNDMNWKGPFIEGEHIMKLNHPNFECYIKF